MWLTDREKQIRAWANQEQLLETLTEEDIFQRISGQLVQMKNRQIYPRCAIGRILALVIVLANKKDLTLEDCLWYTLSEITERGLDFEAVKSFYCEQCWNPNCMSDGK